jgi:hypothetical protein
MEEGDLMKHLKQGMLLATFLIAAPIFACNEEGTEGFVPENNLKIYTHTKRAGGLTQEQFNKAIDKVETVYAPIVEGMGAKLNIVRKWEDATVNAYAQQSGKTWMVSMFGGLARHETITEDGMSLVVCHEIGHHIGGAPRKVSAWSGSSWASNEGQSDYWATLKCLRKAWLNEDTEEIIKTMEVPAALTASCDKQYLWAIERAVCIRGGMAGLSVANLFKALANDAKAPAFDTPDTKVVTRTNDAHPASQCRLDTYFQGAMCDQSYNEDTESASEVKGTCHATLGHSVGLRPNCWFKPAVL